VAEERFRAHDIAREPAEKPKPNLYRDMLNDRKLIMQLCGLERRTTRAGRDSIDHMPGAHDDVCNAGAGVASPRDG
jgi:hypothetical protein